MTTTNSIGRLVLRIGSLALFGFLAITFAGAILTLASVVLFFALIGFVLWLPMHTLVFGPKATWRPKLDRGTALCRHGLSALGGVCHASVNRVRAARQTIRGTASFLGVALVEMLSGALVGVLLMSTVRDANAGPSIALAAGVGACAGLLVVLARRRSLCV